MRLAAPAHPEPPLADRVAARCGRLVVMTAAFLVPLVFYLNGNEAFETPKSYTMRLMALACLAAVLWRGRPLATRSLAGFGIFLAACVASTWRTQLLSASGERIWELASIALLAVAAEAGVAPARGVLATALFSQFLVTCYSSLQYLGVDFIAWTSFGDNRVYSTMGNPDFLGQQSSFLAPVLVGLLIGSPATHVRIMAAACLVLALPSVLYTGSRGGTLALAGAFMTMVWLVHRFVNRLNSVRLLLWGGGFAVVLVGMLMALPTGRAFVNRWMEFRDPVNAATVQTRLFYWHSGWLMGTDYHPRTAAHPLAVFGSGIGGFHLAGAQTQGQAAEIWAKRWPRRPEIASPHLELYAHNDYVHLFAEIGPVGLGIFLWLLWTLLRAGTAALARTPPGARGRIWLLIGLEAAVVSYAVNSMSNFPLKAVSNAHVFIACIAPVLIGLTSLPARVLALRGGPAAGAAAASAALILGAVGAAAVGASQYLKLGHVYTQAGQHDRALGYFGNAAALNPIHTDAILVHYYRGKALQNAGDLPGAIGAFDRAIGTFTNFPEGHQGRGIARSALAAQSAIGSTPYVAGVEAAVADLERARFLNPKDAVTAFFLGRAFRMRRTPADSVTPYLDAIRYSGDKIPDAWWELAQSYAESGRPAEAVAAIETLSGRFPGSMSPAAQALLARARAATRKGR